MNKVFNLRKFYKKAFYEGDRGYWLRNSRAWPNCIKCKIQSKNKSRHEAYQECMEEYNQWEQDKWLLTYSQCYSDAVTDRTNKATPGSKGPIIDGKQKS